MAVGVAPFTYRFGEFDLQPSERRLLRGDVPVPIGPLALEVLLVLVRKQDKVVTKAELLATVWPKVVVEENALQAQISMLRKVLGPDVIETVIGRGYRFVHPVTPVAATRAHGPKHNLPKAINNFIGRTSEREEIRQRLRSARIVTLTGTGGCGKTRLALELAHEVQEHWDEGPWFVELASLTDAQMVPRALARATQVPDQGGRASSDALVDQLAGRQLLVVLDNAEHLLAACAEVVDNIVRHCPGVHVLVTSRAPLGIADEVCYRVPPLPMLDSVRLFVDRARLHSPGFEYTTENALPLASVCKGLDGIPLAIELAAARVRTMSIEEIERRLDQRFALIRAHAPGVVPRQRTLRTLIDWSYDLLTPSEQAVLRRLGHFHGGCTAHAARHVCSGLGVDEQAVAGILQSLVDKSLLVSNEHELAQRFLMLNSVRHYALERLSESGELPEGQARHFDYFFEASRQNEAARRSGQLKEGLARLEADHDNYRAAMGWSMSAQGSVSRGIRLAFTLTDLWFGNHMEEARTTFQKLLSTRPEEQEPALRAEVLNQVAYGNTRIGQLDAAKAQHEEAMELGRRHNVRSVTAFALWGLSEIARTRGDFVSAKSLLEACVTQYRELGEMGLAADAQRDYGRVLQLLGDLTAARRALQEALEFNRANGRLHSVAATLTILAGLLRDTGDLEEATLVAEEALVIQRELNRRIGWAYVVRLLAALACDRGDFASARKHLAECLPVFIEQGSERLAMVLALETLGHAWRVDQPLKAARAWGAMERLRSDLDSPLRPIEAKRLEDGIAQACDRCRDADAFDAAWREGRSWTLAQANAFALAAT